MILAHILKDKYLRIAFGASGGALAVAGWLVYTYFGHTTAPFILHFDAYEKIDFLGDTTKMFGIVGTGFVMILINLVLADLLYTRERFLSYMFAWTATAVAGLILIAIFAILGAN